MNRIYTFLLSLVALRTAIYGRDDGYIRARCQLQDPTGKNNVSGRLKLSQKYGKPRVLIRGIIDGLHRGLHGFHVHTNGDVSQNCSSVGPHFNPLNKTHGAPQDHERHVGSLGNVKANMWGIADVHINDSMISLQETSDLSILNRSLVIHADADDLGKGGMQKV